MGAGSPLHRVCGPSGMGCDGVLSGRLCFWPVDFLELGDQMHLCPMSLVLPPQVGEVAAVTSA